MNYSVKELLILPPEEKIILADLLYSSANDELEENKKVHEWWKDEHFVDQLDKEYEEWKLGATTGYTIEDAKDFMKKQKVNRTANGL
ncbi:MAG: addiction module protein [Ginsengibacter sp.]